MKTSNSITWRIDQAVKKYDWRFVFKETFRELENFNDSMIAKWLIKKNGYEIASPAEMAFKQERNIKILY